MLKFAIIAVLVLVLVAGAFVVVRMGPSNVIGMLRYDQRQEGTLKVGDKAPDVLLLAPDGTTPVHLSSRLGGRPHVVLLGSFT